MMWGCSYYVFLEKKQLIIFFVFFNYFNVLILIINFKKLKNILF
jgi:hypothetical protein